MTGREHALQCAIATWLRLALREPATFFAVPNGAHLRGDYAQRGRQMQRLKREGFVSGVPDLQVIAGGRAIFLEVKTEVGRLSPAQIAQHGVLRAAGCPVEVVRSIDDVASALRRHGVATRAE